MEPSVIICPVCQASLTRTAHRYQCAQGHSFDVAGEGYVNLLLSHLRKTRHPGDDKAMIQARRRFLDSGAYAPLIEALSETVPDSGFVLDCGCGEGHLLGALKGRRFGLDISKEAIRAAARRYKEPTWIVANGMRQLPFADQSLDVILSVLAPRNAAEFARILKPGGRLILGVPGLNHLLELRTLLAVSTDDFAKKADEAAAQCHPDFSEIARQHIRYKCRLNTQQLGDLVQMTPLFWNSSPEAKARIQGLSEVSVTTCFVVQTFRKHGG